MKNLSRLTALLLALVVFATMSAFAEGAVPQSELDMKSYSQMRSSMLDGSYQYFVDQLTKLDVDARYAKLVEWHESGLGTLFYNGFINYYKTAYPDGDLLCTCAAPLAYGEPGHNADCGWRAVEGTQLVDETTGVTVAGDLPTGLNLSVEPAALADVEAYLPELAGMENAHKVFDISLMQGRGTEEWQPETPVTVSMDVSDLGKNGDHMLVYHVHENEDGTVATELMGPFTVTDGQISFEMNRFSFVLVLNGTNTIPDVAAFYLASKDGKYPVANNGNVNIIGVYYEDNDGKPGNAHVLLGGLTNNLKNIQSQTDGVTINGKSVTDYSFKIYSGNTSQIKDGDGNVLAEHNTWTGVIDVDVGQAEITQIFILSTTANHGWEIAALEVPLVLDYEIIKTVAAGTSADESVTFADSVTVDRGDWVIFKINVNNKGTRELQDMIVQDILPAGVFDMNSVQMSIDGENGAIGNWQSFNQTLFSNYDSPAGTSRLLYVKAQVRTDLAITEDTTYTNTATIEGMNMPIYTDTADVVVAAPKFGTLTVSKAVTSANPNDPAPADAEFIFKVEHSDTTKTSFSYTVDGVENSVTNDSTFTLKNGESAVFEEFPNGEFKITETNAAGYTTKVNGTEGTSYEGTMTSGASPVVAFENQFSMRTGALNITKVVEKEYEKDIVPATHEYAFNVVIRDNLEGEQQYTYTVDGGTGGTVTNSANGNTIMLKAGQTATIEGLPVGAGYTVTEVLGELAEHYKEVRIGETVTDTVTDAMPVGGASVTFTNVYKKHLTDLTITKTGCNNTLDAGQSFLFTVSNGSDVNLTIAINGNGSETISGLAVGDTITVTEIESWSWRYNAQPVSITLQATGNSVTVANTRDEIYWLDGDCYAENIFSGVAK